MTDIEIREGLALGDIVTVDAARLNRLIAVAGELKTQLAERDRRIAELERREQANASRIAELEADKERLDWLEKAYGPNQVIELCVLHSAGTLRAAIDAARKERAR